MRVPRFKNITLIKEAWFLRFLEIKFGITRSNDCLFCANSQIYSLMFMLCWCEKQHSRQHVSLKGLLINQFLMQHDFVNKKKHLKADQHEVCIKKTWDYNPGCKFTKPIFTKTNYKTLSKSPSTYMFCFGRTIIEHNQLEEKRQSVIRKHESELIWNGSWTEIFFNTRKFEQKKKNS